MSLVCRLRVGRSAAALGLALVALIVSPLARADEAAPTPDPYHELETKYLFGFTEGADIGAEGEQSIELETTTQFGRRSGHYGTLEQEIEYEGVPSQFFGYELSAHFLGYSISNAPGFANASGVGFSGFSTELRYLVIGRGPGSPIGLTITAEPEWARLDDGGQPTTDFNSTFRAIADTELVPNHVYGAINLIWTPDYASPSGQPWASSSTWGASAAAAVRVTPKVTVGAEAEYDGAFDGIGFQNWQGGALYVGPTLQIQFTGKVMLSAAWEFQAAGRTTGANYGLDLIDFPRQQGNLKFEVEF